jgi:hypothetical protein
LRTPMLQPLCQPPAEQRISWFQRAPLNPYS